MKIVLTGGGTGGHFYPIVAVAEELRDIARTEKILEPKLYYFAPNQYNSKELFDREINFEMVPAGKRRKYSSILNFIDIFVMGYGILVALVKLFFIFPDVVFSKGGYVSFPAVLAARILGIPVVIHESDSVPGRVNAWTGKFAARVALSYKEAAQYFPEGVTAYTGNPVRKELITTLTSGAYEYLHLEKDIPVIFILGGSQGSQIINDAILSALPRLVQKYQIIHQTGRKNFAEVSNTADVVLENSNFKGRYKPFDYLNTLAMKMSAGVSNLIISRGGSTIFEIACWAVPSIIIPITSSNGDHQRKNAYNYAREGGAIVIEEANLSSEIIVSEVDRILSNEDTKKAMSEASAKFARKDSANLIAQEILKIALTHERN